LDTLSSSKCKEIIERNGGVFLPEKDSRLTHLVSSLDTEFIISDETRLQFYPGLKELISFATKNHIHIVNEKYILDTDRTKQLLLEDDYELFTKKEKKESQLDSRLDSLISLVFDRKSIDATLRSVGIDRSFLDTASISKLKEAFDLLDKMSELLSLKQSVADLTNSFLSIVPMVGELKKTEFDNDDVTKLKEILASIETFGGTAELLRSVPSNASHEVLYKSLDINITPLEKNSSMFINIEQAVKNSSSVLYPDFSLSVIDAFSVEKPSETKSFEKYNSLNNHWLLWHGSRLCNYIGILKNGLRICPAEAPLHGQLLGRGIYLTDMACKAAFYCHPSSSSKTVCLLIAEGAYGKWFETAHPKYVNPISLKKNGFDSTKAWGKYEPNHFMDIKMFSFLIFFLFY